MPTGSMHALRMQQHMQHRGIATGSMHALRMQHPIAGGEVMRAAIS
jgi:hypothetical protein